MPVVLPDFTTAVGLSFTVKPVLEILGFTTIVQMLACYSCLLYISDLDDFLVYSNVNTVGGGFSFFLSPCCLLFKVQHCYDTHYHSCHHPQPLKTSSMTFIADCCVVLQIFLMIPFLPLFFAAMTFMYLTYTWGNSVHEQGKKKNPADYENDE